MAQNDELYDEWANDGGGGAPVVSWVNAEPGEPGDTFTGIVLPPDPLTDPAKGYKIVKDRDEDGWRVWPPAVGYTPKPGVNPKSPISENEYLRITDGDRTDMRYVTLTELTLATEYTDKEFFSKPRRKQAREDADFVDNGIRRFIVDGADIPPKFRAAVQKARTRGAQPGQRFTITLSGREAAAKGEKNLFTITLEPPTQASMEIVKKYIAEAKSTAESAGTEDPWAQGQDPEPAF